MSKEKKQMEAAPPEREPSGAARAGARAGQIYPNAIRASEHFKWTELIVSARRPDLAAKYQALYPQGTWPLLTAPQLWQPARKQYLVERIKAKASPFILNNPVSIVMASHLANLVEPLRRALGGRPMKVISGWRPPELNEAVSGAELSGHMLGVATDIAADKETRQLARQWAIERQRAHGDIGFFKTYATFFHIGSRRGYSDGIIDGTRYRQR